MKFISFAIITVSVGHIELMEAAQKDMQPPALSISVGLSNEQVVVSGAYDTRRPAQRDVGRARARCLGE
jgi:Flp pilus assembly secretin CpaC